jgi:hypothetical protein
MKKRPASLEALIAEPEQLAGRTVIPFTPARPQLEKLTVYVPKAAAKRLKQMALDHERRINDFLQEGVDLMLTKYGERTLREFETR